MNSAELTTLDNIYKNVLKDGRQYYKYAERNATIESAQYLESFATYLREMNDKLSVILDLTDKYAYECFEKATHIRKSVDLNEQYKHDQSRMFKVHSELYRGMSWADIADAEDSAQDANKAVNQIIEEEKNNEHKLILYKKLNSINGVKIGFDYELPIINRIADIPPAFYWFGGDDNNKEGIYTCLSQNFAVRVPLPQVIDASVSGNRSNSIKCKYVSQEACLAVRQEVASRYRSDIRECTFAHTGDKFVKIGNAYRCAMTHFGRHSTLKNDLTSLPLDDVKSLLFNALPDALLASLWSRRNALPTPLIFEDIEVC